MHSIRSLSHAASEATTGKQDSAYSIVPASLRLVFKGQPKPTQINLSIGSLADVSKILTPGLPVTGLIQSLSHTNTDSWEIISPFASLRGAVQVTDLPLRIDKIASPSSRLWLPSASKMRTSFCWDSKSLAAQKRRLDDAIGSHTNIYECHSKFLQG